LVDGTTVSAPGATQPTWRLIVTFDPARQTTIGLDLSPAKVGEGLGRAALGHGDLVVGDRGFARPEGLASVRQQGADFLVRLGSRSLRLLAPDDSRVLDRQALLDQATVEGRLDQPVLIGHSRHRNWDPVPARLIVLPLPADAAAANACKLTRAGQREGYQPSTLAEQASGWLIFLTSLDAAEFTAETVAAIYRLRWQIELVIKKFKSLGHLDKLPAHSPGLAKAWLHANLLVSLLVEDLSTQVPDSPPSESRSAIASRLALAALGRVDNPPEGGHPWPNLAPLPCARHLETAAPSHRVPAKAHPSSVIRLKLAHMRERGNPDGLHLLGRLGMLRLLVRCPALVR
jgi:hypothetical protein